MGLAVSTNQTRFLRICLQNKFSTSPLWLHATSNLSKINCYNMYTIHTLYSSQISWIEYHSLDISLVSNWTNPRSLQPLFKFLHISLHIPADVPGCFPLDPGHVYLDWSFWKVQTDQISQFKEKSRQSEARPEDIERYRKDSMMRLKTIDSQYHLSEIT